MEFGYGGQGPSDACRALQLAGLPEETAHTVFTRNGVNYLIEDGGSIRERDFGEPPPSLPKLATDGSLVVVIHGYESNECGAEELRDWIEYLDDEGNSPPWKNGPRRISLYPLRDDAEQDGFVSDDGVPQLIIEQGDLQIWLVEFVHDSEKVWIPRQYRRYLEILGELPEDTVARDDASPFRRWWTSHADRRPRIIELGEGKVNRVPRIGKK
ncbi:hypothetical protein [Mycobacterium talmoniae]|uniref:hypothetical protein n=1 Tax=Mycobacterium talmoniae TaxID=1858794 RepID=UPI001058BEEE|nr:hypothetical protein [Mycobacterium talmoniae]